MKLKLHFLVSHLSPLVAGFAATPMGARQQDQAHVAARRDGGGQVRQETMDLAERGPAVIRGRRES